MSAKNRIRSIDILRGLIMIIMALDHTRDFFHAGSLTADPLNPATTSLALYLTRWITHLCAPTFLLLSGLSAYLSSKNKTPAEAGNFLIKRGFWLIFVEIVIVTFGLTFRPFYEIVFLQVIWAIGCSMILLGLLSRLSYKLVLITGLLLFFGHNILNHIALPESGLSGNLWKIFFTTSAYILPLGKQHVLGVFYAILPWTSVMFIGYAVGPLFSNKFDASKRKKLLIYSGFALILLAVGLRFLNGYGNPLPYKDYPSVQQDIFSFFNVSKYPPSLQYLGMTLGPALILLAFAENMRGKWTDIVAVYGKVPLFYFVVHFYLLHILLVIVFFASGYSASDISNPAIPFNFKPADLGFSLPVVYAIWLGIVAVLYLPCKWFMTYKQTHKKWWLSYL